MSSNEQFRWSGSREILCVDPDSRISPLSSELEAAGWRLAFTSNPADVAQRCRREKHEVGILCFDDVDYAERILEVDGFVHWIAVVSDETVMNEESQRLLSKHFYDYHRFPIDVNRLVVTLGRASGIAHLRRLHNNAGQRSVDGLIGSCPEILEIKKKVSRVAGKDLPVLITGESGTGKELIAREIHKQSRRSAEPFVAVNCAALPAALIQSELFGHERGAFTGAEKRRLGRFEAASGGTLFLDEIGDLPIDLQVNLLRVLEEGVIERIGDNRSRPVDVRVIYATNIDLEKAVAEKRFREDLYFRINVFPIHAPPLRDRGRDLLELAGAFLDRLNNDEKAPKSFSRRTVEAMYAYSWPGNVRELLNRMQAAHVSCDTRVILPEHLGLDSIDEEHLQRSITLEEARDEVERVVLAESMRRNGNNISKVSREVGVSRVTLYRLLKKYDLHSPGKNGESVDPDSPSVFH